MSDLRTAAQQALELLKELQGGCTDSDDGTVEALTVWCPEVIADLEAALEQPEQEPVAEWLTGCPGCGMDGGCDCDEGTCNPPRREWRGLTEEEMIDIQDRCGVTILRDEFLAIEAALKEKNHD
jgi:hypothetical protein